MSEADKIHAGAKRAAVLMMSLGETEASDILRLMEPNEVQTLGLAMATLKDVSRDEADDVLNQFVLTIESQSPLAIGTQDYMRKVLVNAFGDSRADALLERIFTGGGEIGGLESLKWMSPESVAAMISTEHPQIVAIVLAALEQEQAGQVLGLIEEEARTDVLMRVAKLDDVQQSALAEIEAMIASRSETAATPRPQRVGGEKAAADIVNAMAGKGGTELLEAVTALDEELGQRIQEMMFVFESLLSVDDRGIQSLLREVSNTDLSIALKGAEPSLRDKFFRNMSKRAATLMREDMDASGPVKLSDVEEAQKSIIATARTMADAGDLNLGNSGDEYV